MGDQVLIGGAALQRLQRPGRQDDEDVAKPAHAARPGMPGGESDDASLPEAGEVPPFPKSLNDFYKGKWYAGIGVLRAQPQTPHAPPPRARAGGTIPCACAARARGRDTAAGAWLRRHPGPPPTHTHHTR